MQLNILGCTGQPSPTLSQCQARQRIFCPQKSIALRLGNSIVGQCFSNCNMPGKHLGLILNLDFDLVGVKWGPRLPMSNEVPRDADVTGPGTTV